MDNQDRIAHLGFIQGVINRMGSNSFLIKSFAVTLMSALFAFLSDKGHYYILIIPLLLFWWLDAFFLHQERLYRKLYEKVASGEVTSQLFTMNADKYKCEVGSIWRIALSKTLSTFYGVLLFIFIMFVIVS